MKVRDLRLWLAELDDEEDEVFIDAGGCFLVALPDEEMIEIGQIPKGR